MKTLSALGLKPEAFWEGEREEEKRGKKKGLEEKRFFCQERYCSGGKPKSFEEKRKGKKRLKKGLPPISEERRASKRRLLKLAKDYCSEDEASAITVEPMDAAAPTAKPAT